MEKLHIRLLPLLLAALCGPARVAHADDIPLDLLKESNGGSRFMYRLGINVGLNGGSPREYMFDTGSTSFNIDVGTGTNVPWFPDQNAHGTPYPYLYGDGTYGFWQQNVGLTNVQFYNASSGQQVSSYAPSTAMPAATVLDSINTYKHYGPDSGMTPGALITVNPRGFYFQDLTWQQNLDKGLAPLEGNFFGIFGAGEFIHPGQNGGLPGMLTTTGYVVEANGTSSTPGNCGQACFILGLTPALRAQFLSVEPWLPAPQGYQPTFNASGAHASANQAGITFNYSLNNGPTVAIPTLLDTGTPGIDVTSQGLHDSETAAGRLDKSNTEVAGVSLTVTGASPGSQSTSVTTGNGNAGDKSNVLTINTAPVSRATYGISFFMHNAVMYDLENQATGYTPFYVTDAPLTTNLTITADMGQLGLAGVISGKGPLTVASGGFANLSGTNTYTGATVINHGGWLGLAGPGSIATSSGVQDDGVFDISRVSNGATITSLSGSGTVALGGSTLELTKASGTFSGQLADGGLGDGAGGGLIIAGGLETLSGKAVYTGSTGTGPQGALLLTGSVQGAVIDAGWLGGNGRMGSLAVLGVVAPGNGPGMYQTLTVNGSYHQLAGSSYLAQINPTTASSHIAVHGAALLDTGAGLQVLAAAVPGQLYIKGTQYNLLTAGGGVSGHYTALSLPMLSAVLTLAPSYDANNVYLNVVQRAALNALGGTRNEVAALSGVQSLSASNPVFSAVSSLPNNGMILAAADSLSGEMHASTQAALIDDSRFMRDAVTNRLHQATSATSGQGPTVQEHVNGVTAWGQFVGSWDRLDGDGNASRLTDNVGGFLVGADMGLGDHARIGLASGYTRTAFRSTLSTHSASDDDYLGAYAGGQWNAWAVRGGLAFTQHTLSINRSENLPYLSSATWSRNKAYTRQAFGEAGYDLTFHRTTLEPFAQLAYVQLQNDGFQEQGGVAALSGHGSQHGVTYSTLGAHVDTSFPLQGDTFTAFGTLGWRHASGYLDPTSVQAFAGGTDFTVAGVPIAKDAAVLDVGMQVQVRKDVTLNLSYNGQIARHAVDSGFNGGFTWRF